LQPVAISRKFGALETGRNKPKPLASVATNAALVSVQPIDAGRQYLGPFWDHVVEFRTTAGTLQPVPERYDGTYARLLVYPKGTVPVVTVTVQNKPLPPIVVATGCLGLLLRPFLWLWRKILALVTRRMKKAASPASRCATTPTGWIGETNRGAGGLRGAGDPRCGLNRGNDVADTSARGPAGEGRRPVILTPRDGKIASVTGHVRLMTAAAVSARSGTPVSNRLARSSAEVSSPRSQRP
jgi:hypothetical protein